MAEITDKQLGTLERLPQEIRDMIYDHIIIAKKAGHHHVLKHDRKDGSLNRFQRVGDIKINNMPPLLLASKRIMTELTYQAGAHNTVYITIFQDRVEYLDADVDFRHIDNSYQAEDPYLYALDVSADDDKLVRVPRMNIAVAVEQIELTNILQLKGKDPEREAPKKKTKKRVTVKRAAHEVLAEEVRAMGRHDRAIEKARRNRGDIERKASEAAQSRVAFERDPAQEEEMMNKGSRAHPKGNTADLSQSGDGRSGAGRYGGGYERSYYFVEQTAAGEDRRTTPEGTKARARGKKIEALRSSEVAAIISALEPAFLV
ncbi:uncharacterized protein LTR77_001954 [Saxophila tyrrhenica]|uniref:Uncharacterized protein n=1 Tax=Saxophila tyrrhenica TaxID=1690608 RepID=A0AAV9PLU9_9PEZI|nr:hypothetical protein LTR77_001954 [Saxophila tyrrhenica]